jgi:hypothetical protein
MRQADLNGRDQSRRLILGLPHPSSRDYGRGWVVGYGRGYATGWRTGQIDGGIEGTSAAYRWRKEKRERMREYCETHGC